MAAEGWKSPRIQREFFDVFARSKNFDPLDAEKWYSITRRDVLNAVSITFSV